MNDKTRPVLFMGGLIILALALAGCKPTQTVSVANTIEAAVFPYEITEPGIGSSMTWVDGSLFVYVPPGEFIMGQDAPSETDYSPAHPVNLAGFWIHQSEVTNSLYALCVAEGGCSAPFQDPDVPYWYGMSMYYNYPVVGVNYNQASAYCDWIQGLLPTEAQWEKAGRGWVGDPFPWGIDEPTCSLLNFAGCLSVAQPDRIRNHPAGDSSYLLGDTAGNVFEWVRDWHAEDYYETSPVQNPEGPAQGTERVVRSSSYLTEINDLPIYLRDSLKPEENRPDLGFRCILTGEAVYNPPPQLCAVPGYIPPDVATRPASEGELFDVTDAAWCNVAAVFGNVNLEFDSDVTEDQFDVTSSNGGALTKTWNAATPNIYTMTGPGVPANSTVFLTICPHNPPLPPPPQVPLCPSGYEFDPGDDVCRYALSPGGAGECDAAHHFVSGYGCMPIWTGGVCPPGWFKAFPIDPEDPIVCLPWGGPAACVDNPDCSGNQLCAVGEYDPALDCCMVYPDLTPFCNEGYVYNPVFNKCFAPAPSAACKTLEVVIICTSDDDHQDDGDGTNDGGQPGQPNGCMRGNDCLPCGPQQAPDCTLP